MLQGKRGAGLRDFSQAIGDSPTLLLPVSFFARPRSRSAEGIVFAENAGPSLLARPWAFAIGRRAYLKKRNVE